jgi:hypothetical protein
MTYIAIINRNVGYVLDTYPGERAGTLRQYGEKVVGEFGSATEALEKIRKIMADRCNALEIRHWWDKP